MQQQQLYRALRSSVRGSTYCTAATKQHLHVIDAKITTSAARKNNTVDVHIDIANVAAFVAHKMLMDDVDIRINSHTAGAEINEPHRAERVEIVHRLVHSFQRNSRHLAARGFKYCFDRGVRGIAFELAQDALTLWRDAETICT